MEVLKEKGVTERNKRHMSTNHELIYSSLHTCADGSTVKRNTCVHGISQDRSCLNLHKTTGDWQFFLLLAH